MKEIELKGQAFRTYLEVVREAWGKSVEQQLVSSLTDDFREALERRVLISSGWYPVAWYRQFYEILPLLVPSESRLGVFMGKATVKKDLQGMYSFFLKLTSPELVARHLDKIIGSYMRGGVATMEVTANAAIGRLGGWHGVNRAIWEEFCAGGQLVLETAGACNLKSEVKELAPGTALFSYQWSR